MIQKKNKEILHPDPEADLVLGGRRDPAPGAAGVMTPGAKFTGRRLVRPQNGRTYHLQ